MKWELLYRFDYLEIWKTPTKYLTCYHYNREFYFVDSKDEALAIARELLNK